MFAKLSGVVGKVYQKCYWKGQLFCWESINPGIDNSVAKSIFSNKLNKFKLFQVDLFI